MGHSAASSHWDEPASVLELSWGGEAWSELGREAKMDCWDWMSRLAELRSGYMGTRTFSAPAFRGCPLGPGSSPILIPHKYPWSIFPWLLHLNIQNLNIAFSVWLCQTTKSKTPPPPPPQLPSPAPSVISPSWIFFSVLITISNGLMYVFICLLSVPHQNWNSWWQRSYSLVGSPVPCTLFNKYVLNEFHSCQGGAEEGGLRRWWVIANRHILKFCFQKCISLSWKSK